MVVFSHGFSVDGTESARLFLDLAHAVVLPMNGAAILFDYRGNGYSSGKFEDMTFDSQAADLAAVLEWTTRTFPNPGPTYVWGMSFGCAVASYVAPNVPAVDGLILWCLSAELYDRYSERLGQDIVTNGHVFLDKGFKLNLSFLESLKGRDIYEAIRLFNRPTLLVHGTADTTASVELSRRAHAAAIESSELVEIDGGVHGFKLQPEPMRHAIAATGNWLVRNLTHQQQSADGTSGVESSG